MEVFINVLSASPYFAPTVYFRPIESHRYFSDNSHSKHTQQQFHKPGVYYYQQCYFNISSTTEQFVNSTHY